MTHISRDPVVLFAISIMGAIQAVLQGSIFWKIGTNQYKLDDPLYNVHITGNFLGLAFLVCSDQFISMSFGQVLQIPIALPIFTREVSNHMYSSTAYYLSTTVASILSFLFYPIVVSIVSFWMFGLDDSSFVSFLNWTAILTMTAAAGFSFGLMLGTFISNEIAAI